MLDKLMGGNNIIVPEIDEEQSLPKQKKIGLFEYVNQISSNSIPIIVDNGYSEFMVNKMLSEYIDCILVIGLANRAKFLDKQSHFNFLQKSITTKTKRFSKKSSCNQEELQNILLAILLSKKWECSVREAINNIHILTESEKRGYFLKYKSVLDINFFEQNKSYFLRNYTKNEIESMLKTMNNEME